MSNDLISREALIKWIDDSISQYGHTYSTDMLNIWGLFKDYLINNAPTVDIGKEVWEKANELLEKRLTYLERSKGEWINFNSYYHRCNKCGRSVGFDYIDPEHGNWFNFCPNCGTDMKGANK